MIDTDTRSECSSKNYRSNRERELDELRLKGLAQTRRTKLKDFEAPLITPEEAQHFLATMRDKSKKEGIDHKPPTNLSADGVDAWYMQQRHREQELRQRRKEASELLRGYRAPYRDDSSIEFGASPRYGRGRASLNNLSESLIDPASPSGRRRSAMPRMEQGWDQREDDNGERDGRYEGHERQQFGPERFDFLREQSSYANEQYDRECIAEGRSSFPGDLGDPNFLSPEPQPRPQPRRFQSRPNLNIDTSASQNRLRDADGMKSHVQFSASMDTSSLAPIPETVWRDFISPEPGAKFAPEAGRYHLYASYACPGSHRALIVRALKGLEDVVSVSIVHPTWRHTNATNQEDKHRGWVFGDPNGEEFQNTTGRGGPFPPAYPGNEPDPILGAFSVREIYEYANDTSGKYTIPLLFDKKTMTIVNNESSDISYMLNSCFDQFSTNSGLDLYTEDDEDGLDKLNEVSEWLYPMMIHGVYRCGFAKTQKAYDLAIEELTEAFDMADELLQHQRYLTGNTLTDADIRLFVTLLRFDEVYAFYFRANTRLVMLTPSLLNFCREIYQMPGVAETCHMDQIKAHFFGSHAEWNKYSVIPRGLGFMRLLDAPHDRDGLGRAIQFAIPPPDCSVSTTTTNFMDMFDPSPEPIITEEMDNQPIYSMDNQPTYSNTAAGTKSKFLKKARKRLIAGFGRSSDSKSSSPTKSSLSMVPKISMVPKKAATEYRSLTPTAVDAVTWTKPSKANQQPPTGRNFSPPIRAQSLTGTSGTQSYHRSSTTIDNTYPTDSSGGDQPKRFSNHLRRPSLDPGPFHQSSPRISSSLSSANATTTTTTTNTTIPVQYQRDRSPNQNRSSDCGSAASDSSPPLRDRVNLWRQKKVFRNPDDDQQGFQNE